MSSIFLPPHLSHNVPYEIDAGGYGLPSKPSQLATKAPLETRVKRTVTLPTSTYEKSSKRVQSQPAPQGKSSVADRLNGLFRTFEAKPRYCPYGRPSHFQAPYMTNSSLSAPVSNSFYPPNPQCFFPPSNVFSQHTQQQHWPVEAPQSVDFLASEQSREPTPSSKDDRCNLVTEIAAGTIIWNPTENTQFGSNSTETVQNVVDSYPIQCQQQAVSAHPSNVNNYVAPKEELTQHFVEPASEASFVQKEENTISIQRDDPYFLKKESSNQNTVESIRLELGALPSTRSSDSLPMFPEITEGLGPLTPRELPVLSSVTATADTLGPSGLDMDLLDFMNFDSDNSAGALHLPANSFSPLQSQPTDEGVEAQNSFLGGVSICKRCGCTQPSFSFPAFDFDTFSDSDMCYSCAKKDQAKHTLDILDSMF